MNFKKSHSILFLMLLSIFAQGQKQEFVIHDGWKAKRAVEVPADGTVISSPEFKFYGWMDAVVPGTVLTTMLHNQLVPDPFFGLNNELIPDLDDTGPGYYTFWFQNRLDLPELAPDQQVWLKFRGINYSADIFLNGHRVNHVTHRGMFLRQKYRITPYLNLSNHNNLAVLVNPPRPAGNANGGQGGDGTIARSVTQQYTAGWDWVCPVRDRNTGIWDQVSIEITGPVDIRDPFVKSRVPGKRMPGQKQDPAFLTISADLCNATETEQKGNLVVSTDEKEWSVPVTLNPEEHKTITFPEIEIKNPRLWWPNGMGEPHLEHLDIRFEQQGRISDQETVTFGIRENDSCFDEKTGGRVFLINGQKIFIKGGNWISSDLLLRLSPERYEAEVRMHAEMNMNMIRIWGGSITERPEFFTACDQYGILVWQDLWVTGDCNGRWFDPMKKESQARRRAYPDDHNLFLESVADQVKMVRNHPSLYLWCGGNEFPPPGNIDKKLREEIFPRYDGTRYYLNESTSPDLLRNTIGGNGDGPYSIQQPERFFNTPSYPFNPEIGSVGVPNVETLQKMMDEKDLEPPRHDQPNHVWSYHKYIGYDDFIEHFEEIRGVADFCKKAQVVNYEQYRALQEGFNAGMWNQYTGMLVWKSQNPWTSLRGQFYDVYLDQTGGFYGYKHGAAPLHIQLNLNDSSICVVNQTPWDTGPLKAETLLFSMKGEPLHKQSFPSEVKALSVQVAGKLNTAHNPEGLFFVRLMLKKPDGEVLDENLYWLTNKKTDMQQLNELNEASLEITTEQTNEGDHRIFVKNEGNETAFFIRLKARNNETGKLALPLFFDDNYFTLFPGEQKSIKADLSYLPLSADPANLQLEAEPWNGPLIKVKWNYKQ